MLDLAVLGLLKEKPMSGYELRKQLTAKFGAFWRVSFGSLYPCLKRLAADGALEVSDGPSQSRRTRVYRLTDRGELLFVELLESADVHDLEQDRFSLRLAFFSYLRPETRLEQLEQRRGYLQTWVAEVKSSLRHARDRMDAYTISLMDHGLDEREREIAWLDRLIAAERDVAEPRPRRTRRGRAGAGPQAGAQPGAPTGTPPPPEQAAASVAAPPAPGAASSLAAGSTDRAEDIEPDGHSPQAVTPTAGALHA